MSYRIEYTSEARQDLRDIYTYIAEKLMVPETAARQVNRIMDAADGLTEMPSRFSLYEFEPWCSQGLRFRKQWLLFISCRSIRCCLKMLSRPMMYG